MVKVLVTGGSGFVAGHCIKQLLKQDYEVVFTVRSDGKGKRVVDAVTPDSNVTQATKSKVSYQIVADVAEKGAFNEVFKSTPDITYVLHTASPFHYNVQDPVKDFLEPAVNGVNNVLQAIKDYAPLVKRVVLTSSLAAVLGGSDAKPPFYDESSWNPITWDEAASDNKKAYRGSKTLAEQAAWNFISSQSSSFDLVAINPSLVFGPAAPHLTEHSDLSSLNISNQRILHMLQGRMKDKIEPTGFYNWVNVHDVAYAHVRAMEVPEAGGKRFLLMAGHFSNRELAMIIAGIGEEWKARLPAAAFEGPSDILGDLEREGVEEIYGFDNSRSKEILGVEYTGLEESVKETVESLLKMGIEEVNEDQPKA